MRTRRRRCCWEINENFSGFIANVVWSSFKRDIVCCGLVSSPIQRLINLIWSIVCLNHTICPTSVTPVTTRTLFRTHIRHFSLSRIQSGRWFTNSRFIHLTETLQSESWKDGFDASLCHWSSLSSSVYPSFILNRIEKKSLCFEKDTIRDEIYSLTFFLLKEKGQKNYFRSIMCQNRRFHISNTHSQLFALWGRTKGQKFNILCVWNNPFFSSFCRFFFSADDKNEIVWLLHFNLIMDELVNSGELMRRVDWS